MASGLPRDSSRSYVVLTRPFPCLRWMNMTTLLLVARETAGKMIPSSCQVQRPILHPLMNPSMSVLADEMDNSLGFVVSRTPLEIAGTALLSGEQTQAQHKRSEKTGHKTGSLGRWSYSAVAALDILVHDEASPSQQPPAVRHSLAETILEISPGLQLQPPMSTWSCIPSIQLHIPDTGSSTGGGGHTTSHCGRR